MGIRSFVVLLLLTLAPLGSVYASTAEDHEYIYDLKEAPGKEGLYALGFYSAFFMHEVGHVVGGLLMFAYPTKFKPWPISKGGGHFQFGEVYSKGTFLTPMKLAPPVIEISGVLANIAGAYFGAQLIPQASDIYMREYLIGTVYSNAIYFPLYILTDIAFNNPDSDFVRFGKHTGIGRGWFLLPSLAVGYGLVVHAMKYQNMQPHAGVVNSKTHKLTGVVSTAARLDVLRFSPGTKFSLLVDPLREMGGLGLSHAF